MNTLEQLYDPTKKTLHLNYNNLKLLQNLSELFAFIEKHNIKIFSIQGPENCLLSGVSYPLFVNLINAINRNKTLIEVNLHLFRPIITKDSINYLIKDLLFSHPTLERVFLSRYDQLGCYSYVINK